MTTSYELPPSVPPSDGAETAAAVLAIIEGSPEVHDQADWGICGTTRCVGGWANWLHGDPVASGATASVHLGIPLTHLDRLDENAWNLFYAASDGEAVEALRYLARGERIDWKAFAPDLMPMSTYHYSAAYYDSMCAYYDSLED